MIGGKKMKYDFTTVPNREGHGSGKWAMMREKKPDVSKGVIPFSVADMELKNSPEVIEGLKKFLDEVVLGYSSPTKAYYDSVISWMKRRHNFDVKAEWIQVTAGIVPAFFNAIRVFSNKGDGVIVMSPVYHPFYFAIEENKRTRVDCPLKLDKDNYYTIDFDLLDELASKEENKILLFCSPHNPVGRVWKKEELERVAEIVLKHDLLLISDEIHHDLIMPGYKHTVFQTLSEELADRTITCTATSKSFNLAGMSLSNIIIKNPKIKERFIAGLNEVKGIPISSLSFKACEIAYNESEGWFDELLKLIDTNQRLVHDYLKEHHPEIKARLIEGTYLQWLDFRALNMTNEELDKFLEQKCELFFNSGYIFGDNGSGFMRWNLACPTSLIQEGLERLTKGLNKIKA